MKSVRTSQSSVASITLLTSTTRRSSVFPRSAAPHTVARSCVFKLPRASGPPLAGLAPWRACEFLGSQAETRVLLFSMSPKLSDKKVAVLGAGKLAGILLRAYLDQ